MRYLSCLFGCILSFAALGDGTILRSVAEALNLSDENCRVRHAFDFSGEVLSQSGKTYWHFRDATGGVEIHNGSPHLGAFPRGTNVRIRGSMSNADYGIRELVADSIEFLGGGTVPSPHVAAAADIQSGLFDFRLVRLRGVISSIVRDEVDVSAFWATLRTETGNIYLTVETELDLTTNPNDYIDAEVEVTGLASPITGLRRNLGRRISIDEGDAVTVLRPPPTDPFSAPGLGKTHQLHRQTMHGSVLAVGNRQIFVKSLAGQVFSVSPVSADPLPRAGQRVTVSGFTTDVSYRRRLSDARVRIDGTAEMNDEQIVLRTVESFFVTPDGLDRIDSLSDGSYVRVRGISRRWGTNEIRISSGSYGMALNISDMQALGIPVPEDGSLLDVTGLCIAEFGNPVSPANYPTFTRFMIFPRSAADVNVVSRPPWWTPFRLLVIITILASVIVLSFCWNLLLKRKSEQRGRELYEEKIDHALAEQKVEERTRLAVELHDSVSQTLTGVALQLDGGEVETAKTMLASCRGELRRCLWDLRSRTFEEKDMTEAVTRTITPHLNGCVASVRFNVPRERLSESLTHAILRIIRELVVNAIRHGQAKHVKIAGEMHDNTVSFSVTDDGQGFDPDKAPGPEQGHFGLLGIRERIEDFNGNLEIASTHKRGAKFTVTLTTTDESNEQD